MSENRVVPGMIFRNEFILPESAKDTGFDGYINYINREAAVSSNEDFGKYTDYMSRKTALGDCSVFTEKKDFLTKEEKKELKAAFRQAQKNGSILWRPVISFDDNNRWLEETGLYNREDGNLRTDKLKEYTSLMMSELIARENLSGALWCGSIHFNTDNIHIHIAMAEIHPTREKGKFKYRNIEAAKRAFVSAALKQQDENIKISKLMRENILSKIRQAEFQSDEGMAEKLYRIYELLPEDRRLWKYNNNAMKKVRPNIDELTQQLIEKYAADDFEELMELLKKQEKIYLRAYGGGEDGSSNYIENRLKELKTRAGNTIIGRIRDYDSKIRAEEFRKRKSADGTEKQKRKAYRKKNDNLLRKSVYELRRLMKKDIESMKNQAAFERLQAEIEEEEITK